MRPSALPLPFIWKRRLPSLLIRPGSGTRAHSDHPSPSTDRDIDLPKPLAHDTARRQAQQYRPALLIRRKIPPRSSARAPARSPSPPTPWTDFRQMVKPRGDFVWGQEHRLVRLPRLERPTQKQPAAIRRGLKLVDHPEHACTRSPFSAVTVRSRASPVRRIPG